MNYSHIPVLAQECLRGLNLNPDGIYVDCTLGGAGHSRLIADGLSEKGLLIGIDQDQDAIDNAREALADVQDRIQIVHSNFSRFDEILTEFGIDKVDGVLMDIGVSSHQFDEQERGFSYRMNAVLDMRMDRRSKLTAYELVNESSKEELEDLFWRYGEEKWGRRIAEFIVKAREEEPVETTFDLVEIIDAAIPKKVRAEGSHPAKRVFQALRIAVNAELDVLGATIPKIVERLVPGGRIVIVTFHSLEDRIVKNTFRELSTGCICPADFPICICNHEKQLKIINNKPITATEEELELNPRAKSAKLRIAERV
ncbi:MAG: 16S rRNA (cytosine(1402)-N(4))-methyltransferase RsmH [Tissierellia bacterium]|nr:16S rRNA (cytosine(1402)-N(4))-methyltransferase RsmH [Tissierellia bacterium]